MADEKTVPWQNKTIMLVAVVMAAVAVVLNYLYINRIENKQEEERVSVWVTTKTVESGRSIQPEDVRETRVPAPTDEDKRPYVRAGERSELANVRELKVRRRLQKGEPLRWDMFTERGESDFSMVIKPDHRAFPIEVDARHSSPLVRPGGKIDLIGLLQLPGPDNNPLPPQAEVLLEAVEVLAVGSFWSPDEAKAGSTGAQTRLVIQVHREQVPDLATILKLIPPPMVVLRRPTDETVLNLGGNARLAEFRKKALTQKLSPDRAILLPPAF
jgi:Flp pilus assembly protein CpaB